MSIYRNLPAAALAFGLLAVSGSAQAANLYEIDPSHSSAQFSVRHLMISNVKGEFSKVKGTVVYDPNNLADSKIEAVIDANSINTREEKRDAHLKSPDFLDTAKHPALTFKSKQLWKANNKIQAKGDLTIRGITREVVLDIDGPTPAQKDPWGNLRIGATATTRFNRKDWGLTWNQALESGGVVVGDEVSITLDIEAIQKAPAAIISGAKVQ
jgi:polyisoprenoid-binding protein YceI